MAKNELLPFASGEDANVLPTAQWEALTDILQNGFQSGVAKSEQVNRVLAQGAVASYVLGQMIVDKLSKDATLDKDTLYQNLLKALQENAKDACLPLAGGKMTGRISTTVNESISLSVSSGNCYVAKAERTDTGKRVMFGVGMGGSARGIYDNTTDKWLVKFDEDNILKTKDEVVLTDAGGTLKGNILFANNSFLLNENNTGWSRLCGGAEFSSGARIQLAGKDCSGYEGQAWIVARDPDENKENILRILPNGGFTLGGKDVDVVDAKTLARSGYIKYKNGLVFIWGMDQGTAQSRTITKLVSCSTLVAIPFDGLYSDTGVKYVAWRPDLSTTTTETFKCVDGNTGAIGYFIIGSV